jgi:hypothetical protein
MRRYSMSAVAISTVDSEGKYVEYEQLQKLLIASDQALEALYYVVQCEEIIATQSEAMQKELRATFANLNIAIVDIKGVKR